MFTIPSQTDVDSLLTAAKLALMNEPDIKIPKTLQPPSGRPVTNAAKRREEFYKQAPAAKRRRSNSCSLGLKDNHISACFPLRELFS